MFLIKLVRQNYIGVCVSKVPTFILVYDPALNCVLSPPHVFPDTAVCVGGAPPEHLLVTFDMRCVGLLWTFFKPTVNNVRFLVPRSHKLREQENRRVCQNVTRLTKQLKCFDARASARMWWIFSSSYRLKNGVYTQLLSILRNAITPPQTFCYDYSDF